MSFSVSRPIPALSLQTAYFQAVLCTISATGAQMHTICLSCITPGTGVWPHCNRIGIFKVQSECLGLVVLYINEIQADPQSSVPAPASFRTKYGFFAECATKYNV